MQRGSPGTAQIRIVSQDLNALAAARQISDASLVRSLKSSTISAQMVSGTSSAHKQRSCGRNEPNFPNLQFVHLVHGLVVEASRFEHSSIGLCCLDHRSELKHHSAQLAKVLSGTKTFFERTAPA